MDGLIARNHRGVTLILAIKDPRKGNEIHSCYNVDEYRAGISEQGNVCRRNIRSMNERRNRINRISAIRIKPMRK